MRFLRRSLWGVFLLSLTAGLVVVAFAQIYGALQTRWAEDTPDRPARERVYAVNTVTVESQRIAPILTTYGQIESRRNLELRASASGRAVYVAENFTTGGRVSAGEVLLRLDSRDAEGALATAAADLSEAEADLAEALLAFDLAEDELAAAQAQADLRSRSLARQRDLLDRNVGTESAVEEAELAASNAEQAVLSRRQSLAQARARIDQARITLDRRRIALSEAERRLADTEIDAPFSGILGSVTLTEGGLVANNERLAELVDPSVLEVSFTVSTRQYAQLLGEATALPRMQIEAALDVLGTELVATGQIVRESAIVAEGETGRRLFARLDAAPGFRPGDFVTIRVKEPPLDGVTRLPATSVDAAQTVLVVGEADRLEVAPVTVLRREGNDVIVRAGAIEGRNVVAERTPFLGQGIRVTAIDPASERQAQEPEMLTLDDDRRQRLVAFVESNDRMPQAAKDRILNQLAQPTVPAQVVQRLESRMGG